MLLAARWVLPISSPAVEDGAVVVRDGRIAAVGPRRHVMANHPEDEVHDLGCVALLPGFVNAHAHLEITLLRGRLAGLSYDRWIRRLVELRRAVLPDHAATDSSLLGAAEMIRAGITCVADCSDSAAGFDALAVSGLRGRAYREVFAPAAGLASEALERLEDQLSGLDALGNGRVEPGISPHSPYMACPALLEGAAALAVERGIGLSIHLAEADAEVAFVRDGSGPIAERHASRGWEVAPRGCSPVEHVARHGWLALPVPVQFVHLARATEADLDLLAASARLGPSFGAALCPRSNANLGNGLPDAAGLARRGIPWGLGTDGAPAVGACDLFAEMRFMLHAARAVARDPTAMAADDVLRAATLGGAEALGYADRIGSLAPGREADLVAVDLDHARCDPAADPAAAIVESCGPADVRLTMVTGEVLFDGAAVLTLDEKRLRARCGEHARIKDPPRA